MSNNAHIKAVEPTLNPDFTRLKQATAAVDMIPEFGDVDDRSLMDYVIAAEQELDIQVSDRANAQRKRDLTVNNYKIKRGKLREMYELMVKELDSEEEAAIKEVDRHLRLSSLVIDASRKKLEVLSRKGAE